MVVRGHLIGTSGSRSLAPRWVDFQGSPGLSLVQAALTVARSALGSVLASVFSIYLNPKLSVFADAGHSFTTFQSFKMALI
jgi:hypothetical protein